MNSKEQLMRKRVKARQVGRACKARRLQANLSIRDISNATGYSTQLIYGFEAGKSTNYIILFDCYINLIGDLSEQLVKDIRRLTEV